MSNWTKNIELVEENLPQPVLERLHKMDVLDDDTKKVAIACLLEERYIQVVDWLYSTLEGQQSTRVFELRPKDF